VSSKESSDNHVGNEMGPLDLIDYQVDREEIPRCQVGKGSELRLVEGLMSSEMSSDQQGDLTEEDHKYIMIIGGVEVLLPSSPVEATTHVAGAAIGEGQPTTIVIEEEEKEQMLMSSLLEEENAIKMITPWEKELEMLEDWLNNLEPVDDCHEKIIT